MSHLKRILPVVICAALFVTACQQGTSESMSSSTSSVEKNASESSVGWKTYNYLDRFSFSYPADIKIEESEDDNYFEISGLNFDASEAGSNFTGNQYKIQIHVGKKNNSQVRCYAAMFQDEPNPPVLHKIAVGGFTGYRWTTENDDYLLCFSMSDETINAAMYGAADSSIKEKFITSFVIGKKN
jgi:hypothetical protein